MAAKSLDESQEQLGSSRDMENISNDKLQEGNTTPSCKLMKCDVQTFIPQYYASDRHTFSRDSSSQTLQQAQTSSRQYDNEVQTTIPQYCVSERDNNLPAASDFEQQRHHTLTLKEDTSTSHSLPVTYNALQDSTTHKLKKTGTVYTISESPVPDIVVLYSYHTNEVYSLKLPDNTLDHFECSRNIWRMTSLSSTRHVMIEYDTHKVHLLNPNLKSITTMENEDGWTPQGIHFKDNTTCILSEIANDNCETRFVEVSINLSYASYCKRLLCSVKGSHWRGIMALAGQNIIMANTETSLLIVNMNTGESENVDLSQHLSGSILSVHQSGTYTLVGDVCAIHKLRGSEYKRVAMKLDARPEGITVKENYIVITSRKIVNVKRKCLLN